MKTKTVLAAIALISAVPSVLSAQTGIPNARLEVTVRQEENGQIKKGYHVLDLLCWNGQCSLTSLSLNQCGPGASGKEVFYPKIERTSTQEGNLKVTRQGNVLVVQETGSDVGGDYVTTHRIGFEPPQADAIFATRVTSYSGGYVKDSQILKQVITVNFVALRSRFQEEALDCAVLLPGVDSDK